jgi:hypothetical protein
VPQTEDAGADSLAISRNVASFAFRDQGRWDELRNLFHPDAQIAVTWYRGPVAGFIEGSAQMSAAAGAAVSKHLIGVPRVTVSGSRALSDTDVIILARAKIGPLEVDVTSYLRFFDRFERRDDGVWRVACRTGVYEKDRIDPVAPSPLFPLVYWLAGFHRFPPACRHLAGGLVRNGHALAMPIIEVGTEGEAALRRDAELWLTGAV